MASAAVVSIASLEGGGGGGGGAGRRRLRMRMAATTTTTTTAAAAAAAETQAGCTTLRQELQRKAVHAANAGSCISTTAAMAKTSPPPLRKKFGAIARGIYADHSGRSMHALDCIKYPFLRLYDACTRRENLESAEQRTILHANAERCWHKNFGCIVLVALITLFCTVLWFACFAPQLSEHIELPTSLDHWDNAEPTMVASAARMRCVPIGDDQFANRQPLRTRSRLDIDQHLYLVELQSHMAAFVRREPVGGLAAIHLGIGANWCAMAIDDGGDGGGDIVFMVNPSVHWRATKKRTGAETSRFCATEIDVSRSVEVIMEYNTEKGGKRIRRSFNGRSAIYVLHLFDQLQGIPIC
jgi:peptide deformylase